MMCQCLFCYHTSTRITTSMCTLEPCIQGILNVTYEADRTVMALAFTFLVPSSNIHSLQLVTIRHSMLYYQECIMICFLQKYILLLSLTLVWVIPSYINSYTYLFANQLQGLCFLLKVAFTGGQVLFHWHIATGKQYLILHHSYIGACMLHNNLLMLWSHVLPCYCDQYCQLLHVLKGHEHSVFMVNSTLHFGHGFHLLL